MAELRKPWSDSGELAVGYTGSGDGEMILSSDIAESLDREMTIAVADPARKIVVERTVRQVGMREVLRFTDGVFRLADGGTFNVLKAEFANDEPKETYIPLEYIEATGEQFIDLGYVVKEGDVIKMAYENRSTTSADKFFFGTSAGNVGIWVSQYSSSTYVRFGHSASATISTIRTGRELTLRKGKITVGSSSTTLGYTAMPATSLYLFAGYRESSGAYAFGYVRCMQFEIINANGDTVMLLSPRKRGSDGKVGLLDGISGRFFINQGAGNDFVAGPEINE